DAGRIMFAELKRLAGAHQSFAFESTLACRTIATWIVRLCRESGYTFELVYMSVRNPELAVNRVVGRVRAGGHHVPEAVVRRRWQRSLDNLFNLYMPIAHEWRVFNNGDAGPELIANGSREREVNLGNAELWSQMQEQRS